MLKVAICIPHGDRVTMRFFQNLMVLHYYTLGQRGDVQFFYIEIDCHMVSLARDKIVQKALDAECDYLFWVDDDVLPPEDALVKLLGHGLPFVSGLYMTRLYPHTPQIYVRTPVDVNGGWSYKPVLEYPEAVISVDAVGHGCCLVDTGVYKVLRDMIPVQSVFGVKLSNWYEFLTNRGEDFYFCDRLKDVGVEVMIDTTVKCAHMTEDDVVEAHFKQLMRDGKVPENVN